MLRFPKGMKNYSAIFQRLVETILKDIPCVLVYRDNILLRAPSSDILARRLSAALNPLGREERDGKPGEMNSQHNRGEVSRAFDVG